MPLGDNKGNQIKLPHATWKTFIAKRIDIEQLLQSPAPLLCRAGTFGNPGREKGDQLPTLLPLYGAFNKITE